MNTTKKIKLLELKFKKNLWSNLFGAYITTFSWSGMEFNEVRKYEFWESLKNIDWKTTAKKAELYTKKFDEERDVNVIFAVDISNTFDFWSREMKKIDFMQEIIYAIWENVVLNNDNIWAIFFDNEVKDIIFPQKWQQILYKIIEKTKTWETQNKDISKVFAELSKKHIKKSVIFVLSDFVWEFETKILKKLALENHIIYINIFDEIEDNLLSWEQTLSLWSDFLNISFSNEKIAMYKKFRQEKLDNFKKLLQKNHTNYIHLNTSMNLYDELVKGFYMI